MHAHEMIELSELYGAENVEAAAIALTTFKDNDGLHVLIEPTKAKLQLILEAVYGVAVKSIEHPLGATWERAAAFATRGEAKRPPPDVLANGELDELIEKYGQRNVENAMIHITELCDSTGLYIAMNATVEKTRKVLEACFDDVPPAPRYLIWSFEHRGWWCLNWLGYSPERSKAGIYSAEEAMEIVTKANIVTINEALVPITHAMGEDIIAGGKQHVPQ